MGVGSFEGRLTPDPYLSRSLLPIFHEEVLLPHTPMAVIFSSAKPPETMSQDNPLPCLC